MEEFADNARRAIAYAAAGLLNQLVNLAHGDSTTLGPSGVKQAAGALLSVADALERAGFLGDEDGEGLVDLKVRVLAPDEEVEIRRQAEEGDGDEWEPEGSGSPDGEPVHAPAPVPQDFAERLHSYLIAHGAVAGRTLALALGITAPPREAQRLEQTILAECAHTAALAIARGYIGG